MNAKPFIMPLKLCKLFWHPQSLELHRNSLRLDDGTKKTFNGKGYTVHPWKKAPKPRVYCYLKLAKVPLRLSQKTC